jgi:hypothetical protein
MGIFLAFPCGRPIGSQICRNPSRKSVCTHPVVPIGCPIRKNFGTLRTCGINVAYTWSRKNNSFPSLWIDMTPATACLPAEPSSAIVPSSVDVRLKALARKALASSGYASISTLECQVCDGVVILRGVVNSYYLKQVAQESVRRIGPVDRIENRVRVEY